MFNIFGKSKHFNNPVKVDIHSHLLPNIDDGVNDLDESIMILKKFHDMGYKKIVTTPHIMKEYYDNNKDTITQQYENLQKRLQTEDFHIEVEFAAEYYIDEFFIEKIEKKEELLTFGDEFILVETSFYNAPVFLKDVLFQLMTKGYTPVFAHPERYIYLLQNTRLLKELKDMQVLLQVNMGSLSGHYGKPVKKLAEKIIESNWIDFIGSDCHNLNHIEIFEKTVHSKLYQSLPFDRLRNNILIRK